MYKLILKQMTQNKVFYLNITLGLLILSFISGKNLSILNNTNISIIEFILITMSDEYYLVYGMISIFLLILLGSVGIKNDIYYIRQPRFIIYFIHRSIANFIFSTFFVLLHVIIIALIGITTFNISSDFNANFNLLNIYKDNFNTPILALIIMCIYMIIGLFFITILFEFINHFVNKNITILFLIITYLSIWLGIRKPDQGKFYFIYLNNFFMIEYGIQNIISLLIIEMLSVLSILYFMNKKWWIKS